MLIMCECYDFTLTYRMYIVNVYLDGNHLKHFLIFLFINIKKLLYVQNFNFIIITIINFKLFKSFYYYY